MSFGYNDIFWILSVILWTTGVTAIIILIMKRRGRTENSPDLTMNDNILSSIAKETHSSVLFKIIFSFNAY